MLGLQLSGGRAKLLQDHQNYQAGSHAQQEAQNPDKNKSNKIFFAQTNIILCGNISEPKKPCEIGVFFLSKKKNL